MPIPQAALEEAILFLLAYNEQYSPQIALRLQDARLFSNKTNQIIAQKCLEYISSHSAPPKKTTLEYLLETEVQRGEEGRLIRKKLDDLEKAELDPEFIMGELTHFIELQFLTTALQDGLELAQQGQLEESRERIFRASSFRQNGSPGLWMKDINQSLKFFEANEHEDFFSSGIEVLDRRGVRPDRKTIMFMIASSGMGKSWFLIDSIGKRGLQHHHKVLHITLEISEEKTARRYIQSIFSLTRDEAKQIQVSYFHKDEFGATIIQIGQLERDSILNKKEEIREKLHYWTSCPEWIIKEFPTSSFSTEQLSLYLDSLEKQKGFKPDLLIIDYADLMKLDTQSLRIDTGRLYRELRGIAVSKNLALVTATQGNRDSASAKLVNSSNVSEDWSKIGTGDVVLTYSQTPEERVRGLARIFVAKSRDVGDKFITLVSQNYTIGQFSMDSTLMSSDLVNQISEYKSS